MKKIIKITVFQFVFLILGTLLWILDYYLNDVRFYGLSELFIGISLGIYIGSSIMKKRRNKK